MPSASVAADGAATPDVVAGTLGIAAGGALEAPSVTGDGGGAGGAGVMAATTDVPCCSGRLIVRPTFSFPLVLIRFRRARASGEMPYSPATLTIVSPFCTR